MRYNSELYIQKLAQHTDARGMDTKEARASLIQLSGIWRGPFQQISSAHAIAQAFTELILCWNILLIAKFREYSE